MKTNNIEITNVNQVYADCKTWDSIIILTAWSNGEGFDLQITSKNGCIQTMAITFAEFYLMKEMIDKLETL